MTRIRDAKQKRSTTKTSTPKRCDRRPATHRMAGGGDLVDAALDAFVSRTTRASGVGYFIDDAGTVEQVAAVLR